VDVSIGHNIVGIIGEDGTQQFFHLVRGEGGEALMVPYQNTSAAALAKWKIYSITVLPSTASGIKDALTAATKTVPDAVSGQAWATLGPNCVTGATDVLRAGGVSVPWWAQSSLLLHTAVQFPYLGEGAIGVSGAIAGGATAAATDPNQ
jgi:hypothetical protein